MKLNDVQEKNGSVLNFGLNEFVFDKLTVKPASEKGSAQLEFSFTKEVTDSDKPINQLFWLFLSESFKDEDAWKFLSKLKQFVDVRACATSTEEAEEFFQELKANSPEFDNSNITEVQNFQIKFVEKMLEPVLGKKVNLVLHWKGEFLNVPYYKENDYKLPFGLAPHMSKNLKTEKQPKVDIPQVDNSGW